MENISKALVMAGGVLIAVLLIALLIRSFTGVRQFQMSQLTEEEQKELIAFNEKYTKYAGQYIYGTDLITIINGALDNTIYPITVKVKFVNENGYEYNGYKYNPTTKRYEKEKITIKKRYNTGI